MKNIFFWRKSLFQKFVLSFCVTVLFPVMIIGGISYFRSSHQIEMQTEKLLGQIVNDVGKQTEMVFREYEWMSLQILSSQEVIDFLNLKNDDYYGKMIFSQWMDKNAINGFLFRKQYVDAVIIFGNNGQVYTGMKEQVTSYTGGQQAVEMVKDLRDSLPEDGSLKLFTHRYEYQQNENSIPGTFFITMGRRIRTASDAQEKGAFFLNIRAAEMSDIWRDVDLQGGFIWIVDENENVIYHQENMQLDKPLKDLIGCNLPEGKSGAFHAEYKGEEYLFVYNTAVYGGWKILSGIRWEDVQKPVSNLRNLIVYTMVIAFPLSVFIGYIFVRSILNPMKKLQKKMKDIGHGNWTVLEGKLPGDEIGELITGFNGMVLKISNLIEQVYKAELERKKEELERNMAELEWRKAELNALQTQINPHFLYNTLNVISAYAITGDSGIIEKMIKALGNMFRYAVRNPMEPVRVRDEIDHVRDFIFIMKCRYGSIPEVVWDIDGYLEASMLRLSLQPIVENVFKYAFPGGIEPYHKMWISAREEDGKFMIEVSDNGVGPALDVDNMPYEPEQTGGNGGVGLANVNRRLVLAYGSGYGLRISGKRGVGMRVSMQMPCLKKKA